MKCTCDTHKTCQIHNPLTDNMNTHTAYTGKRDPINCPANQPKDKPPTEYDDLLPVSLHKSKKGEYYLLDRHNDSVATFEPAMEIEDMERIVALINK